MPAITYRTTDDLLKKIRKNAAEAGKSVPAYLEFFMEMAGSPHGVIQRRTYQKRPARNRIRKGDSV